MLTQRPCLQIVCDADTV